MAAWSASVLTPILAPIVAELTASRLANEQKAETIGRLTAELDAARLQIAALDAAQSPTAGRESAPEPDPTLETIQPISWPYSEHLPPAPWWWRYWPALLVVAVVLLAMALVTSPG
jgi:hypothetical protein